MFNTQTPKNEKAKRLKTFTQNCTGTPLLLRPESNLHLSLSSTGEVTPTPRQYCRAEAASGAGNGSSMLTSLDFLHLKDEYSLTAGWIGGGIWQPSGRLLLRCLDFQHNALHFQCSTLPTHFKNSLCNHWSAYLNDFFLAHGRLFWYSQV